MIIQRSLIIKIETPLVTISDDLHESLLIVDNLRSLQTATIYHSLSRL